MHFYRKSKLFLGLSVLCAVLQAQAGGPDETSYEECSDVPTSGSGPSSPRTPVGVEPHEEGEGSTSQGGSSASSSPGSGPSSSQMLVEDLPIAGETASSQAGSSCSPVSPLEEDLDWWLKKIQPLKP